MTAQDLAKVRAALTESLDDLTSTVHALLGVVYTLQHHVDTLLPEPPKPEPGKYPTVIVPEREGLVLRSYRFPGADRWLLRLEAQKDGLLLSYLTSLSPPDAGHSEPAFFGGLSLGVARAGRFEPIAPGDPEHAITPEWSGVGECTDTVREAALADLGISPETIPDWLDWWCSRLSRVARGEVSP